MADSEFINSRKSVPTNAREGMGLGMGSEHLRNYWKEKALKCQTLGAAVHVIVLVC